MQTCVYPITAPKPSHPFCWLAGQKTVVVTNEEALKYMRLQRLCESTTRGRFHPSNVVLPLVTIRDANRIRTMLRSMGLLRMVRTATAALAWWRTTLAPNQPVLL